ncbi:NAC domain-containing protein 89 [Cannabis sativa]|uniref:NAC domain-containing protein 89 n=1 Tax=Cannabis sativa TaxID=3483 RepID=UPI0029CA32EA|nr:NAC domain-containing protein 89 [Cannabis sativa]
MSCSPIVLPTNAPVGFRFSPTEEEVINHYLKLKYQGKNDVVDPVMATVDFCAFEPWELPRKSMIESNDQVWWFFCPRDYKYNNSRRSNRTTKSGYWKITGKGQKIKSINGVIIGGKRILVFHRSPCPGQGTEWVMHEYHLEPENPKPNQKSYVVCRLERKTDEKALKTTSPDYETGQPSGGNTPDDDSLLSWKFQFPCVNQLNLESLLLPQNSRNDDFGFLTGNQDSFGDVEAAHEALNFANSIIDYPELNDIGATAKRVYFQDGPDSSDTDSEWARDAAKHSVTSVHSPGKEKSNEEPENVRKKAHISSSGDYQLQAGGGELVFGEYVLQAGLGEYVLQAGGGEYELQAGGEEYELQAGGEEYELQAGGVPTVVSSKWKSFFTFEETPTVLSCDTTPPSVYLRNMIVGAVLFLVFALLFACCCLSFPIYLGFKE